MQNFVRENPMAVLADAHRCPENNHCNNSVLAGIGVLALVGTAYSILSKREINTNDIFLFGVGCFFIIAYGIREHRIAERETNNQRALLDNMLNGVDVNNPVALNQRLQEIMQV